MWERSRDDRRVSTTWASPPSSKRAHRTAAGRPARRTSDGRHLHAGQPPRPAQAFARPPRPLQGPARTGGSDEIGPGRSGRSGRFQAPPARPGPGPAGDDLGAASQRRRLRLPSDNRRPRSPVRGARSRLSAGLASPGRRTATCAASASSRSRRPPVFKVAMTRPGGRSPRSHSIHASSSLTGSGGGRSMAPIYGTDTGSAIGPGHTARAHLDVRVGWARSRPYPPCRPCHPCRHRRRRRRPRRPDWASRACRPPAPRWSAAGRRWTPRSAGPSGSPWPGR